MLVNTIHFFSKLCQNNFIIYFIGSFLSRHSLEHLKLGSLGVDEIKSSFSSNTTQHMESHLSLAQVLRKEKMSEIYSEFLQKTNS